MQQSQNRNKEKYLRETLMPTTNTNFFNQDYELNQDFDKADTIKRDISPSKSLKKKDINHRVQLRSTYSPNSQKFFPAQTKKTFYNNNYNWNSTNRISGFNGILGGKHKMNLEQNTQSKSLTNLHNKLNYLEECVNKAKKQLLQKNSKKTYFTTQNIPNQQFKEQFKHDRFKKQRNLIYHTNQNDLKATIKIPQLKQLISNIPKPFDVNGFDIDPYSPRNHNHYYVSSLIRAVDQKNSIGKQHVRSAIKILKLLQNIQIPSYQQVTLKKIKLKRQQKYKDKKTIIFDLDQTLIHCNQNPQMNSDIKLTIKLQNGQFTAGINIRPYAIQLLNQLSKKFQLMIFTASHSSYANVVIDYLDPQNKIFQHRLYRQHCFLTQNGMYVKDLRIINRDLNDLVLIDNAAYSYAFQLQNGIPILNYYEGQDFELKALQKYLQRIYLTKDIRELNKKIFKLHHYTKFNNPQQLIQELYMQN